MPKLAQRFTIIFLHCFSIAALHANDKIPVDASMITQVSGGTRNAALLVDGKVETAWFPGWAAANYPAVLIIDLRKTYNLGKIRLYDGSGQPMLRLSHSTDNKTYSLLLERPLDRYNQWVDWPAEAPLRYLKMELLSAQGDQMIGEMELYTATPGSVSARTSAVPTKRYTGDALKIGVNGFHWVPLELLQPFSFYREYQYWEWMEAARGTNRFEPADGAEGQFDTHYAALKARGIKPVVCVNQTPDWLLTGYPKKKDYKDFKPVPFGESALEPRSYRHFARFLFQLAARYGRKKVPESQLTLAKTPLTGQTQINQAKSGLDLVEYIEVWNEPDKWWADPEAFFTPQEYAAMLSACFDGHEGRLGPGHGIKTADPTMKVVMAGLSGLNINYLRDMNAWFQANRRDKRFAADVLNLHHYANQNNDLQVKFEVGVSPEANEMKEKLKYAVGEAKKIASGRPVWLTEFGYDTQSNSPQRAVSYEKYSAEEVQGIWLMRTYVEAIAAGVDLAFAYNIIDEDNDKGGLFQSSGLAGSMKSGLRKKSSWERILNLSNTLDGATLAEDLSQGPLRLYRFRQGTHFFILSWTAAAQRGLSDIPQKF
jgi:Glycosyl hydrolase catalytic core